MNYFRILLTTLFVLSFGWMSAQCDFSSSIYQGGPVPTDNVAVNQLSGCNYAGESTEMQNVVAGETYLATSTNATDFLTVTDENGTVLASGTTPLSFTATSSATYLLHIATDAATCGTESACRTTEVACSSCAPPPADPPACSTNETATQVDPACGISDLVFSWDAVADATSYSISVGSAPGLTDIVALTDVGNVTSINFTGITELTSYYWTVVPTNTAGAATGCTENVFTTPVQGACYCPAGSQNGCDEGIDGVTVDGNVITSATGCTVDYTDNTAIVIPMEEGVASTVTITNGPAIYGGDQGTVWIDWNDDYIFDVATEEYLLADINADASIFEGAITPPAGSVGTHLMRVRVSYTGTPVPCGLNSYGEVEDFTVEVTAPANCDPSGLCVTPANITGVAETNTRIKAAFDAVPNADKYQVRFRIVGTTSWTHKTVLSTQTFINFPVMELEPYQFQVRAFCCTGAWTPWSSNVYLSSTYCATPTGISASADGTTITITYTGDPNEINTRAEYRPIGGATWMEWGHYPIGTAGTIIIGTPQGIMPSTTYEYRLKSTCGSGFGYYSSTGTVTTGAAARIGAGFVLDAVYPNPAHDMLNLGLDLEKAGDVVISVRDVLGKVVRNQVIAGTEGIQTPTVEVNGLPRGTYLLSVEVNGTVETHKFMKL